jgi:hypothetical protein
MTCCIPVSGDWYCNKKGSSKISRLATQRENGLGRIDYLRENVIARESLVSVNLSFIIFTDCANVGKVVSVFPDVIYLMTLK